MQLTQADFKKGKSEIVKLKRKSGKDIIVELYYEFGNYHVLLIDDELNENKTYSHAYLRTARSIFKEKTLVAKNRINKEIV